MKVLQVQIKIPTKIPFCKFQKKILLDAVLDSTLLLKNYIVNINHINHIMKVLQNQIFQNHQFTLGPMWFFI